MLDLAADYLWSAFRSELFERAVVLSNGTERGQVQFLLVRILKPVTR